MKRYNSEDYYSVINKNTGVKIVDCAQQEDALLMVSFDPQNRTHYNKQVSNGSGCGCCDAQRTSNQ
jgi:hypothetical protein